MTSLIQAEVQELEGIQIEIKRLLSTLHQLRNRKTEIEKSIISFIETKGHHGLKYGNMVIATEEKPYRLYKSAKDKQISGAHILRSEFGIEDAENAITRLTDAMKGEEETRRKLKLTKQAGHSGGRKGKNKK